MKPFDLSFNWFDLFALALLVTGVFVGRKRGMSTEMLDLIQWLLIVFLGAMASGPFGKTLAEVSGLSPVVTYIMAYLLAAIVIKVVFILIRRMAGEKLVAGDVFGSFEYYLGMTAGLVRFACILIFCLALLSAKQVTKAELDAQLKSQRDNLGSIYFPPFGVIQQNIFEGSLTGRTVKNYLSSQLINIDPSAGGSSNETIGRRREREVNDIMNAK